MWARHFAGLHARFASRNGLDGRSLIVASRSSRQQRFVLASLSGVVTAAAAGTLTACDSDSKYSYKPPKKTSDVRSEEAAKAAQPLRSVPGKPTPRVIFVLGGPGAGKGTQCAKLTSEYGFVHLSAGDLLREERATGSADAEMIESYIREGKIVPVEVTVRLLEKAMNKSGASKFLIDGFPRNFNNLEGWMAHMPPSRAEVDGVLLYDVEEETMVQRLLERGKTSGRSDDNPESIRKRLRTYVESTVPVLEYYAKQGKVSKIYGGNPVDQVFAETRSAVEPTIRAEVLSYNALLLDAISAGDWTAYTKLVSPGVTCFEPEAQATEGVRTISGLKFHKAMFEKGAKARAQAALEGKAVPWSVSTMQGAEVKLLGPKHALVTYTRVVSPASPAPAAAAPGAAAPTPTATAVAESRVWELAADGAWQCIHFHRGQPQSLLK